MLLKSHKVFGFPRPTNLFFGKSKGKNYDPLVIQEHDIVTAHEYSMTIIYLFLLANSYEPLVVSVSVLIHVIYTNWGTCNFQRKVGGEFM